MGVFCCDRHAKLLNLKLNVLKIKKYVFPDFIWLFLTSKWPQKASFLYSTSPHKFPF